MYLHNRQLQLPHKEYFDFVNSAKGDKWWGISAIKLDLPTHCVGEAEHKKWNMTSIFDGQANAEIPNFHLS